MSDPIHGARELFKGYLKGLGVTEAKANLLKKEMVAVMSQQQDWAEKIARGAVDLIANISNRDDLASIKETQVKVISLALKQAREIGRLESNRAVKLPTEIPEEKFIDVRDERGELVKFVELEWFKQFIEALNQ